MVNQMNIRNVFEKLSCSMNAQILNLSAAIALRLKSCPNQINCRYFLRSSVVTDGSQACLPAPNHAVM